MRKDLVQTILYGLDNDLPILSDDTLAAMRLANAAPDLLAALSQIVAKIDDDKIPVSCSLARSVIAKAKA